MPENEFFSFRVLIGGDEVPEYCHRFITYVIADLNTPFTYTREVIAIEPDGQKYTVKQPVTPYTIRLTPKPTLLTGISFYISIDGEQVDSRYLPRYPLQSWISSGFNRRDGVYEFLFSLPHPGDKTKETSDFSPRAEKIGTIEVKAWEATMTHEEETVSPRSDGPGQDDYHQASKRDAATVTNGAYLMTTTAVGRLQRKKATRPGVTTVPHFIFGNCLGTLHVRYDTKETLQGKGVIPNDPKNVLAVIDLTGEKD